MISDRQAMMVRLPVAAVTAALYLVLMALHLLSPSPLVHAVALAMLMSGAAIAFSLRFSRVQADTEQRRPGSLAVFGERSCTKGDTPPLSADEEERLISQLETELDRLEQRYRSELTSMQLAVRKTAGPADKRGRSW